METVGEQTTWGHTEHLLATLVDAVQISNWMFASAYSKSKVDKPKMLQRPGLATDDGRRIGSGRHTMGEMRQILDTWSERDGDEFRTEEVG